MLFILFVADFGNNFRVNSVSVLVSPIVFIVDDEDAIFLNAELVNGNTFSLLCT